MNPSGVLAVFRPHVDATIHTLKLATANKLGDCLGDGRARTKLCKTPDAERSPPAQTLNTLRDELRYRLFRMGAGHRYCVESSEEQSNGWWKAITRCRYSTSSASFTRHSSRRPSEKTWAAEG
ncbi:hypothetical protein FQZ97_1021120 [compost metagenome]